MRQICHRPLLLSAALVCLGFGQPVTQSTTQTPTKPTTQPATQTATQPDDASLPGAWLGTWSGKATLHQPGQVEPVSRFRMTLTVGPFDGDGHDWTLIYESEDGAKQVREYRLVPTGPGRFEMDEQNGIVLPHVLSDGELRAIFAVQAGGRQSSLVSRFCLGDDDEGPGLTVTIDTFFAGPATRPATGLEVTSFEPAMVQHAVLRARE